MKRMITTVALLLAASSLAFCQTSRSGVNDMRRDEQAVRQVVDELTAALERSDFSVVERIYADDYAIVEASGRLTNKTERLAAIKSGDLQYESFVRDTESVRVYGDTAVTVGRVTLKGQSRGQVVSGQFRNTVVLVKRGGYWRVVAAQSTRIAQQ